MAGYGAAAPLSAIEAKAASVAHDAYHEHNETCGCRTVGHLTEHIARSVVAALEPIRAAPEPEPKAEAPKQERPRRIRWSEDTG